MRVEARVSHAAREMIPVRSRTSARVKHTSEVEAVVVGYLQPRQQSLSERAKQQVVFQVDVLHQIVHQLS